MGLLSKLLGRGRPREQAQPAITNEEVELVVNMYGALLARRAAGLGIIADASELPYPKRTIKAALQIAIRQTSDSQIKEQLKVGYISLADWQEEVGPTPLGINF
jgi:hypothetical protein